MTAKASEPRTTMRVPVSFRELVRRKAKESNKTMMEFLVDSIETGVEPRKPSPAATPSAGGTV